MPELPDPAQTAAEALIALGWPVQPTDDFEAWQIGDFVLTDEDLMAFAARRGVYVVGREVQ